MIKKENIDSLSHAFQWQEDACKSAADPFVFLVGTKKDLVVSTTSIENVL